MRQNATPLDFTANAHGMAPTTSTSASLPPWLERFVVAVAKGRQPNKIKLQKK